MGLVKKAVFPVAGLGTRFRPVTTVLPKEMLPVVDRPLIDYGIQEAVEAGITDLIFVVSPAKRIIVDYLSDVDNLKSICRRQGQQREASMLDGLSSPSVNVSFVIQEKPLGLGHAILCARNLVGNDVFAVILPDDLIMSDVSCLAQMLASKEEIGGNFLGVVDVGSDQTHMYGILEFGNVKNNLVKVEGMVEKPHPGQAPSNFAIVGRYILHAEIFDILERQAAGVGAEIQLTEAMHSMLPTQEFHGLKFEGVRYDCGDKVGLLEANIAYSLRRQDLNLRVQKMVASFVATDPKDGGDICG
jgi:UTP--glucose-1-phosphate uridylyltransferase